jgi:hypothetical protein
LSISCLSLSIKPASFSDMLEASFAVTTSMQTIETNQFVDIPKTAPSMSNSTWETQLLPHIPAAQFIRFQMPQLFRVDYVRPLLLPSTFDATVARANVQYWRRFLL